MSALILGVGVGVGALIDVRTRRVPNELTFGLAAAGCAIAVFDLGSVSLGMALAGIAAGLALMLPGHLLGATGAGDVKLFAAAGAFLGPSAAVTAFLYTLIAGGVLAASAAAWRGVFRTAVYRAAVLVRTGGANVVDIEQGLTDNRFPYAPAIAVGVLLAALGV
jgi:prepilin peptidase CpaA